MKKRYTRKHICEALRYWENQLKKLNEAESLYGVVLSIEIPTDGTEETIELLNEEDVTTAGYRWLKKLLIQWLNAALSEDPDGYEAEESIEQMIAVLQRKLQELLDDYMQKGDAAVVLGELDGTEVYIKLKRS
jgi:hypothetical protein